MRRFTKVNEGFTCQNCGKVVEPTLHDTYRNHCPFCLYSKHVDIYPGDRMNDCGGLMKPVSIENGKNGTWVILFRCTLCEDITRNKMALKSPVQPDDFNKALEIARRRSK